MTTDNRRRPGPPDHPVPVSPKTALGKSQIAFTNKRVEANKKAWDTRRAKAPK